VARAEAVYLFTASTGMAASVTGDCVRIFDEGASITFTSAFAANAIEKWEPEAGTPEIWTDQPSSPEIWTPVASTPEVWQNVA
jgi:hypothetical protein